MARITRFTALCDHVATRSGGALDFSVRLSAEDADGQVHTVMDDRGFSVWIRPQGEDPWTGLTEASLRADAKSVFLSDDESAEEELDWDLIVSCLAEMGVPTAPEGLRSVPFEAEVTDTVRRRLHRNTS